MTFSVNVMSVDQQAALTEQLTVDLKQQLAKPMRLALLLAAPALSNNNTLSIKHLALASGATRDAFA
ncbi:hypothetical protein [Shewanella phaeophyticola]|uniref:Uncharacterized protein n=1 Tax=Shewanella phaeophyticola TaxID=2978345 RepID=A0ABT2P3H1_9GAMM|nr:hypothetical protein [Shewanella sp. KJ10-1]MCT8987196.1 hypothetical protein [Shewanella sp. KJ10-1]